MGKSLFRISTAVVVSFALLLAAFGLFAGTGESSDSLVIEIQRDEMPRYRELAAELGLKYDRKYGHLDWVDTKRANDLGIAGEYEFLDCSNGMLEHGMCDYAAGSNYWESIYYSNYDMTVLFLHRSDEETGKSTYKLLKLAEGRQPAIHES